MSPGQIAQLPAEVNAMPIILQVCGHSDYNDQLVTTAKQASVVFHAC
jgi:hypothetical protein